MNVSEGQLKKIISEAIKEVLAESNGVIDERFLALADWIIKRASHGVKKNRWGERSFTIPSNVFGKFDVYGLPFKNLKVELRSYGNDHVWGTSFYGTPVLCLRDDTLRHNDRATIAHELLHIVQSKGDNEKDKSNARGHYTLSSSDKETAHDISYDFDPKELEARITQAAVYLRGQSYTPENLSYALESRYGPERSKEIDFNEFYKFVLGFFPGSTLQGAESLKDILCTYSMQSDIEKIERDNVRDFTLGLICSVQRFAGKPQPFNEKTSPVLGLFMTRPWYLEKIIPDFKKLLGEPKNVFRNDNWYSDYEVPGRRETAMWFVVLKSRLLNYFQKSFEDYKKKVSKSLAPIIKEIYDKIKQETRT